MLNRAAASSQPAGSLPPPPVQWCQWSSSGVTGSTHFGNHLQTLSPLWSEVCGGRGGGVEHLLTLSIGREVGHMTKQPVHQLHMSILEGNQERRLAALVARLERGAHSMYTSSSHLLPSPPLTSCPPLCLPPSPLTSAFPSSPPYLCVCTMFGQHHSYFPVALLAGQKERCAALLRAALNVSIPGHKQLGQISKPLLSCQGQRTLPREVCVCGEGGGGGSNEQLSLSLPSPLTCC